MQVNVGPKGAEERATFVAIETCSFFRDLREMIVGGLPIRVFVAHSLSLPCRFSSSWLARREAIARRNGSRGVPEEKALPAGVCDRGRRSRSAPRRGAEQHSENPS